MNSEQPQLTQPVSTMHAGHRLTSVIALLLTLGNIAYWGLRPATAKSEWFDQLQSLGHFGFFGLLTVIVVVVLARLPQCQAIGRRWHYAIGLAVTIVLGGGLEWVQTFLPSRTASWGDVVCDSLGGVAAIGSLIGLNVPRGARPHRAWQRSLGWLIAGLATAYAAWPVTEATWICWQRDRAFPVILDWGAPWSAHFDWGSPFVERHVIVAPNDWGRAESLRVADLHFTPGERYPGFGIRWPHADWRGHQALVFDILNKESREIALIVRIHDLHHNNDHSDRYHITFNLQPGWQTCRIPLLEVATAPSSRAMDMRQIAGLRAFVLAPTEPFHLIVGPLRLE